MGAVPVGIDALAVAERRQVAARLAETARAARLVATDGEPSLDWPWRESAQQLRAPTISTAQRAAWWSQAAARRHVRVEAASILHRLSIAQSQAVAVAAPQAPDSSHPVNDEAVEKRRAASAHAIRSLAHVALETVDHRPRWSPSSLIDWWRGTSIEQAYRSLHAARVFLVEVLTPTEVKELAPTVQARICASLPATDSRRLILEQLPNVKDPGVLVARVQAGLEMIYDASDEAHQRIRVFRNILLSAAALIAIFMAAFVLVVTVNPTTIPFCFAPNATTAGVGDAATAAGTAARIVCPHGESTATVVAQPAAEDIAIIAGLGLLGGALASAIAVRKLTGRATPYGVPTALALLKVPTGALTAVSGILLLGGGFVPGLSELDSQRQIVAYALVLGYAQQLVTRLIDDRANALLADVPAKGPESATPTPSAPGPTPLPPEIDLTTSNGADRSTAVASTP